MNRFIRFLMLSAAVLSMAALIPLSADLDAQEKDKQSTFPPNLKVAPLPQFKPLPIKPAPQPNPIKINPAPSPQISGGYLGSSGGQIGYGGVPSPVYPQNPWWYYQPRPIIIGPNPIVIYPPSNPWNPWNNPWNPWNYNYKGGIFGLSGGYGQ